MKWISCLFCLLVLFTMGACQQQGSEKSPGYRMVASLGPCEFLPSGGMRAIIFEDHFRQGFDRPRYLTVGFASPRFDGVSSLFTADSRSVLKLFPAQVRQREKIGVQARFILNDLRNVFGLMISSEKEGTLKNPFLKLVMGGNPKQAVLGLSYIDDQDEEHLVKLTTIPEMNLQRPYEMVMEVASSPGGTLIRGQLLLQNGICVTGISAHLLQTFDSALRGGVFFERARSAKGSPALDKLTMTSW